MKPGDKVTGESGVTWTLGEPLAFQGAEGCTSPYCRRIGDVCVGYHCPKCGEPCSMMGHECDVAA